MTNPRKTPQADSGSAHTAVREFLDGIGDTLRGALLLEGHKCEPVAEMLMDEGRDWWLGKLTEPLADWPRETHCLHITTPIKAVVLGLCEADFDQLTAICYVGNGRHTSQRWIERIAMGMQKRAARRVR